MTIAFPMILAAALAAETPAIPLPEHPRPDWERASWMNLNGSWDFGFAPGAYDRKILVPFGWGSPASGVADAGDTGYYRRTVTVPDAWKGRRVFVVIGASDHDTTVTLDGKVLGTFVGGYVPFEFELTPHVRFGEAQTLEVKAWDPDAKTAREGHYLYGKQGYGNARGIWQTVYLEARGSQYLEQARFTPHLATSSVTAELTLGAPAAVPLTAEVLLDGMRKTLSFAKGERSKSLEIALAKPRLWTPDDPQLYDVTLRLGDDTVRTYFGFREFGVGKTPEGHPCMTLNGKPHYLQICLDQSYHPEGWYTFPSDAFMKEEILLSKKLALSGNRIHIKAEVPRKLYWADKLGLLIQADVPCAWGEPSDAMFAEHWACFEGMVKRDFNHPCIYQWTLFNETWGLKTSPSLKMGLATGKDGHGPTYTQATQARVADCYHRAKALDATRLVEDNSPCHNDHVETDVNTWHSYCAFYLWTDRVEAYCDWTRPGSSRNYVKGAAQGDEPMMNSECGNVWGYHGSTGDCDFSWDYHAMINAFRSHLKCAGFCYTEHHDVTNEWNGYVRFDRSPKFDGMDELAGMALKDLHAPAALTFLRSRADPIGEVCSPGETVHMPLGFSLTTDAFAGRTLSVAYRQWYFDAEGVRHETPEAVDSWTFKAGGWEARRGWDVSFRMPSEPSAGCVVFRLLADGEEIARNFWSFAVRAAAPSPVVAAKAEWSEGSTNVLDGLKLNGFGKGAFEFALDAPAAGGVFRGEFSAKRLNGKDRPVKARGEDVDWMLGGGVADRSANRNSYPQTSADKHPANVKVFVNGRLAKELTLADDPADHRGILSWLAQPHDGYLREAGSYGWLVEVPVAATDVKDGKVTVRVESDAGLAVYGSAYGRYPFDPHVSAR